MVDSSQYSVEERLVTSVWVQTMRQVITMFQRRLRKPPPHKVNLFAWEKRTFAFGSEKDSPRSGRPVNRLNNAPLLLTSSDERLVNRHGSDWRNSECRVRHCVITWSSTCWWSHFDHFSSMKSAMWVWTNMAKRVLYCYNNFLQLRLKEMSVYRRVSNLPQRPLPKCFFLGRRKFTLDVWRPKTMHHTLYCVQILHYTISLDCIFERPVNIPGNASEVVNTRAGRGIMSWYGFSTMVLRIISRCS
jgi:hypothetical protein